MARKKKYTIDEVLRILGKKHDVMLNANNNSLKVLRASSAYAVNDLGNKSWGKVDFLVKHNNWTIEFVDKF